MAKREEEEKKKAQDKADRANMVNQDLIDRKRLEEEEKEIDY